MKTRKNRVLLINPPCDTRYFISVQPPLGLLYLASYLRKDKIDVSVIDLNVRSRNIPALKTVISDIGPTIVGITSNVSNRSNTIALAAAAKLFDKDIITVVGGPQPTIEPGDYASPHIDYIIPFEAEKTMSDFVVSGSRHQRGVFSPRDCSSQNPSFENSRNPVIDLDTLPFPAYDLLDLSGYYVNSFKSRPIVSMITSRGCPHRCIFCNQAVSGRTWRSRSPKNVVEEMSWLKERIGAREISIEDDNFTLDLERAHTICDLMLRNNIDIRWQLANGLRVNGLTKELLTLMKRAGCWKIAIAPEVGDQRSMNRIKKASTMDEFRQVALWCKDIGIEYYAFFIMGFSFQGREEMQKTIDFALELDPLLMDLSKIVPFKGTEYYKGFHNSSSHVGRDIASYYYLGNDSVVEKMYRKAYARFYLRPGKIARIMKIIGFRQFFMLLSYAICVFGFNSGNKRKRKDQCTKER